MSGRAQRTKPITWVTGIALGTVVIGLCAVCFAQFQIRQRSDWRAQHWQLSGDRALTAEVQVELDRETRDNKHIMGQLLYVWVPRLGLDTGFASGPDMLATDDVRVASNMKPFVAAAALQLVEAGRLNLDAPIAPYLSQPVAEIFEKNGRKIDTVSLRHLLNHSSGLADYGSSPLFQALAYVPTAFGLAWHWTPTDEIWFAVTTTQASKVGAHFDYSDTNYLLVADMIAKATPTANPGIALRRLLNWSVIGADETFWEFYEPTPPNTRRIRQFRGAIEDTNLDVSFDQYGGGGLVMSMDDLARAHRAVVRGEVFDHPLETRSLMQAPGSAIGSNGYGLGIAPVVIEGEKCWSHGGRWGTVAVHCPRLDVTITRSWGQSNAGPDAQDPKGAIASIIRLAKMAG